MMSAATHIDIIDAGSTFFAPMSSDVIDGLIGKYKAIRTTIENVSEMVLDDGISPAIAHFINGNKDSYARYSPAVHKLFDKKGAIASLNAEFWQKTLSMTDVLNCMPQKRRDEWNKSIIEMTAPDYTEEAVRPTIAELLNSRHRFMAERVDGIFRGLSGEHVTNSPSAFNKRMIIGYVTSDSYTNSSKAGLINDLRCVIAKFMGRDEPGWSATNKVVSLARHRHGEWITLDGGALRIRCYLKGTAHLEVHPDMAWRLNQVLHSMYPAAIPAEFRTKPTKKHKEFTMIGRPLPFHVVEILAELRRDRNTNVFSLAYHHSNKPDTVLAEAFKTLESIGGVIIKNGSHKIHFDYDPRDALDEIIASGCVPDQKSHQFYPTPERIADDAVSMLDIQPDDDCLEPSAGQGALASLMPQAQTTCVEISKLHADILQAKGFNTICGDFISFSATTDKRFNKVLMNPPFSEGRALSHLKAAASLVKPAGCIVAILPASFKNKDVLPGWNQEWSSVYSNEFAGTSVSVVILKARN